MNGFCFACRTMVADPLGGRSIEDFPVKKRITKSPEEIRAEMEEIAACPVADLPSRKLRKDALEHFGIRLGYDQERGEEVRFAFFPYGLDGELKAWKTVHMPDKKMWSVGDQREVDLFGWEQAVATGAKRLLITEGEWDAAALWKIVESQTPAQYSDYKPAVVSLPHGAASAQRDLSRLASKIRKEFKEIVFVFDKDAAGRKAVEGGMKALPEALSVELPCKDANACILEGRVKAAYKAVTFKPSKQKNSRLVNAATLHEAAKAPAKWGMAYPWSHVNDATRGIRTGETIYIGAGQKQGKSEIANTLIAWLIEQFDWKVFAAKPEEANNKTYKMVAGKIAKKVFHDPKIEFDEEAYDKAGEVIGDKLILVNLYQHLGWETLKEDIRAAAAEGCKAIFIDPITNLTNGMDAASANTKLQEIAQELSALALDLDVVVFIFCHLRNPDSGDPHERGGKVLSSQFAGSRAMARSCNFMLGLEGNRDPDIPVEERNMRYLVLLENREFGETGRFPLYYDTATGMYNEV